MKNVGGRGEGGCNNPSPVLRGKGWQQKLKNFVISLLLFFPSVITITMFLKYLRHKVGLVRCFTFDLKVEQFIGQIKAFHTNSL